MKRLRVGVFSFACCEGCCISMIESLNKKLFEWEDKVEFVNFRALKKVGKVRDMDVAFVEGAIGAEKDVLKIGEIRAYAKKLIAVGSGAINGWPSNVRNSFTGEKKERVMKLAKELGQLEKVVPISSVVKVDDQIEGCPISEEDFSKKMDKLIEDFGIVKMKKKQDNKDKKDLKKKVVKKKIIKKVKSVKKVKKKVVKKRG